MKAVAASDVTICLVSDQPQLEVLCRDVLAGMPPAKWRLVSGDSPDNLSQAALVIWDIRQQSSIPLLARLEEGQSNVFLVHEVHLEYFCRHLPIAAAVNILVQPTEEMVIREFLETAIDRIMHRRSASDPRRPDRDELFQALLLAGFRLQESQSERVNFFRRALRDLSAPLTAVNGYCGLLIDQRLGRLNVDQIDVLRQMQESVVRLSNLVSVMLHLGQGALDHTDVRPEFADIGASLERAVSEVIPSADAKQIEIRIDVTPSPKLLFFDPALIEQVMVCLLVNACKFTSAGGIVEVRGYPVRWEHITPVVRPSGPWERATEGGGETNGYRIDVHDTGPRIPTEQIPMAFDVSSACVGSWDRSSGGLGLATCKMIVNAHQGEVFVESGEEGTIFAIFIPFSTGANCEASAADR